MSGLAHAYASADTDSESLTPSASPGGRALSASRDNGALQRSRRDPTMLKELRQKKGDLVKAAQDLMDTAAEEKRSDLTADETKKFDDLHGEIERISAHIQRREILAEQERSLAEPAGGGRKVPPQRSDDDDDGRENRAAERQRTRTQLSEHAMRAWLLAGSNKRPSDALVKSAKESGIDPQNRNLDIVLYNRPPSTIEEARALSIDPAYPEQGQYTVPETLQRSLEVAMLQFGGMRQGARVIRTADGGDFRIPTVNDTTNKGEILGQNTQVNQQDVVFSQVVLGAYKYSSKMILVPVELIQDNAVDLPTFIGSALGERIGRITNEHFTVGTGSDQPQGIVGASGVGVTGALEDGMTYEEIVDLEHSVDAAYRSGAKWMFHDKTLAVLKKLKDGDERPLWQAGLAGAAPNTLMGYQYIINNDMPQMGTATNKSIIFGDLTKYWIRDVVGISLLRLDERFADLHQVAFLAFSRHDGDLVDAGTGPVKHFANGAGS